MTDSKSYHPKYDTDALLMFDRFRGDYRPRPWWSPALIVRASNTGMPRPDVFTYWFWAEKELEECVGDKYFRTFTLKEWLWYRHPHTGERMIGRNSSMAFWITLVLCLLLEYGVHFGGPIATPYKIFCEVFIPSIIALWYIGTWMQYRLKWR